MKVIIDRFEGNIAVAELNGEMLNAPRALFSEAQEGDTVELTVLPRRTAQSDPDADPAEQAEQLRVATRRLFGLDQKEEQPDDDPAAMFKKLRNKKKKK